MATLSICLIINNEINFLRRCLSSIKAIASEIIVVDTGSADDSLRVASEFGALVFSFEWENDFSSARNYSLDKASGEWILILDGDEEIERKFHELIQEKIRTPDIDAYLLTVRQPLTKQHEILAASSLQLRLFRNNKNYRYQGIIQEQILDSILDQNPSAVIETASNITIIHHSYTKEDTTDHDRLIRNVALIQQVLERESEEPLKYFFLGREYYRHDKFLEALEYFRLAYDKSDCQAVYIPDLQRSIITSLFMLGKSSEALAFSNDALSIRTDSADLYYLKGIIYKDLGLYSQAFQSLKEARSLFPSPPYRDLFYYHCKYTSLYLLGGLSEYFMDLDSALFYYYESLKNNPYLIDPLRRMITILHPRKNPNYTIDSLNRVFDLSDRNLQSELTSIFYKEGAYQLALDQINQLESNGQISEKIRLFKGLSLMRIKKYSEAEDVLRNITQDKNLYIQALQYLLLYYWIAKDYRTALECRRQIKNAKADPSTVYVLNLLTRSYANKAGIIQEQSYKLAKELMGLIVELGDSNQVDVAFYNLAPIMRERPSYLLAELYYNYEKYELAKAEFLSLLEISNNYPLVYYYLGKTCWALGDLDTALQNLQQAIKSGLDTPRIIWEKARLHQEQAIKILKEGIHHFPDEHVMNQIQELEEKLIEI